MQIPQVHAKEPLSKKSTPSIRQHRLLLHLIVFLAMGCFAWGHGPSVFPTPFPSAVAAAQTVPAPNAANATIPPATPVAEEATDVAAGSQDADAPIRLRIPAIGVDAAVESVGKTDAGGAGIPAVSSNVAWYNAGVQPGEQGNSVISGHLDDRYGPAIFWRLRNLQIGDDVFVTDGDGTEHHFQVTGSEAYPLGAAPLNKIFGFDLERDLNLITCNGSWNSSGQTYNQRLVVYTRLVPPAQ